MTRQPSLLRADVTLRSRDTLASNFSCQYSARVIGTDARRQPLCRCQKQPWTKITVRCRVSTMSGVPGSFLGCSLNRKPIWCRACRTRISGLVFCRPTARMILERSASTGSPPKPQGLSMVPSYCSPAPFASVVIMLLGFSAAELLLFEPANLRAARRHLSSLSESGACPQGGLSRPLRTRP